MDDDMGLAAPGSMEGGEFGPGGMRGQQHWGMSRRGPGMRGFAMRRSRIEDLDLTDAQRKKLADIRDQHAKTGINQRASVQLASLELRKLMRADKPDVGAVERQIDKIASLRSALTKNRMTGMLEARALLTPEQMEKLRSPRGPRPDESR
jgi:Spy/CpxP family protein refolding chaperone